MKPFLVNIQLTLPGPAMLPPFFEKILRISAAALFLLSVNASTIKATPLGP